MLNTPLVEMETSLGAIDLHNYANFTGLSYSINKIVLEWTEHRTGYLLIGKLPVTKFFLVFSDIQNFDLSPFGNGFPESEKMNLEHFIVESFDLNLYKIIFYFGNGQHLNICAKSISSYFE